MNNDLFEVLSPWAEADPIPARGISPRVTGLKGQRIGLYYNSKQAAKPMVNYLELKLKEKYPEAVFTQFGNLAPNEIVTATPVKEAFLDWLKEVDTVIAVVGD
jgi:hypothetical protein